MKVEFQDAVNVFVEDTSNTEQRDFVRTLISMMDDNDSLVYIKGFIEGYSGDY